MTLREDAMGWERSGDGLKLVGVHIDATKVEDAIERLSFARNRPGEMCRLLRESIRRGFFSKDTLMRFSKWCNWDDPSENDAQEASRLLFGEVVPRMRDQGNKPYPNAIGIYQTFLKSVVARYGTPTP
jgi:hypothetical protein